MRRILEPPQVERIARGLLRVTGFEITAAALQPWIFSYSVGIGFSPLFAGSILPEYDKSRIARVEDVVS